MICSRLGVVYDTFGLDFGLIKSVEEIYLSVAVGSFRN